MQMVFVPSRKPMTPMTTARLFEAKPANRHCHSPPRGQPHGSNNRRVINCYCYSSGGRRQIRDMTRKLRPELPVAGCHVINWAMTQADIFMTEGARAAGVPSFIKPSNSIIQFLSHPVENRGLR